MTYPLPDSRAHVLPVWFKWIVNAKFMTMKNGFTILSLLLIVIFSQPLLAQMDFGDAPDPTYPTLSVSNGANHIVGILFLGNQVDGEGDGQPNMLAYGDDAMGIPDDEDGVSFSTWLVPGQNVNLLVVASGMGMLDAWIDFQGNGNWSDPGDQIFTNQVLNAGANNLNFMVPLTASSGIYTYGRFRLSSTGGLLPTGGAIDGEVEDLQIYMGNPMIGDTFMDLDPGLSFTQNEISMAVVPVSGNLIAAYNDQPYPGGPGIGVSYSTDQGQTWNPQQLTIPINSIAGVQMVDVFDPTVTANDSGHIFVAHIGTDFNWATGPVSGLYVHKSVDGGMNWMPPVQVDIQAGAVGNPDPNYRFNDRCQIRADINPASPYYHNIYLAWIQDRGWGGNPLSDIYVSVSTDGGNNFTNAFQINNPLDSLGNLPIPEITSNGDVYVLWMDYNVTTGGNGVMLLDKSTDGGITWSPDITVDTILLPPLRLNGGIDVQAKGAAILRSDPLNPNQLYIVYAADPDTLGPDEADIFFIKSVDGGLTWSSPLCINDDATITDQVLPWMEVRPNGVIDIVWYDRRNDPSDLLWDVYFATSTDGGNSFSMNVQLNTTSFASPQTNSGAWYGEYMALANTNSMAFIGFTSSAIDSKGDVLFTSLGCTVTNTNDSGPGSFRYGLGCVGSGDTLFFDPTMVNDTIILNAPVQISQDVVVYTTGGQNIWIDGSSLSNTIRIMSGANVEINGLQIYGGNGPNGVVWNEGVLVLQNMTITGDGAPGAILHNEGELTLKMGTSIL